MLKALWAKNPVVSSATRKSENASRADNQQERLMIRLSESSETRRQTPHPADWREGEDRVLSA